MKRIQKHETALIIIAQKYTLREHWIEVQSVDTGNCSVQERQYNCALSSQQIVKRFSEKTNDLVRLQHIARAWYLLECFLVLTCYSTILRKNKWMITWFDLQLPWLKANYVDSEAVSLYVFPRTDLHKENKGHRSGYHTFSQPINMNDRLRTMKVVVEKVLHIYLRDEKRNSFVEKISIFRHNQRAALRVSCCRVQHQKRHLLLYKLFWHNWNLWWKVSSQFEYSLRRRADARNVSFSISLPCGNLTLINSFDANANFSVSLSHRRNTFEPTCYNNNNNNNNNKNNNNNNNDNNNCLFTDP